MFFFLIPTYFKFYLQDTKSSNGTFLNGNRLGKSNEDSAPYELTSSDIIQFGVDVTENTKKGNGHFIFICILFLCLIE